MSKPPVLAVVIALAAGGGGAILCQQPGNALKTSTDRDVLERAASALARSRDPRDLTLLGQFLHDPVFLARLDDLSNSKTFHLSRVMGALAEHPTPQVADLCIALADDPGFVAGADRKSFLLETLALVKPMSERAAAVFQNSNDEGYFAFNARLLTANASPRALALFESMMLDKDVPVESRVQCLHVSILPHRGELPILQAADRILSGASETEIVKGVSESVFDYQRQWFGIESKISRPAGWQTLSTPSLRVALQIADKARARPGIDSGLRATIGRARETIAQILAGR